VVSELSTEFKTAFGRMLVGLKMNYTIQNALNYSQTLVEYTYGGLVVMDKVGRYSKYEHAKDYDRDFKQAEYWYKQALSCLQIRGRDHIVQQRILTYCFDINKLIFQIALSEGVLVMNESMFGVMDMFMNPTQQSEEPRRKGR
jgi:hypothetical protein